MIPFEITFSQLRAGSASREATEAIRQVVEAVLDTGKPGKMTIELTVKPNARNKREVEAVKIIDKIKVKLPEEPAESIMFVNSNHELTLNNQRQVDMFPEHVVPKRIIDEHGNIQEVSN